ncbi:MAG: tetratricopeptide repeat protein [Elusimicrobia bacterium]|nr:tetratricopeptide repeat protein [Elusimicrobiota bacterium]
MNPQARALGEPGRTFVLASALAALAAVAAAGAVQGSARPEAIPFLERQASANPGSSRTLFKLGRAYWGARRIDDAWRVASALVKLDPGNRDYLILMANASIEKGDYAAAVALMNRQLVQMPDDHAASMVLARAFFRDGRKSEALMLVDGILAHVPDEAAALHLKEEFLSETGRKREAPAPPDGRSAQYRRAEALAGAKRYDEALAGLDRLIKADPSNGDYRMSRASVLYETGRFDDAIAEWESRAALETPDMNAVRRLRDDAVNRQGWDDAVDWQMKLIAASPRDPAGWENLSWIYGEMEQLPGALWAAERAIAADPVEIGAYLMRAEILEKSGDWSAAAVAYEDVLRRYPNSLRAIDGLSYTLEAKGDYPGALKRIQAIEELTAPCVSPYLELHRARVLTASGRFDMAHKLLGGMEEARRPTIPVLLYHGIARIHRGDSISLRTFREQMLALKKSGYQTLTASELARVFQGKAVLPEKPVLLTFDDGRADSFENADLVLKETGFRATMFVRVSGRRMPYIHSAPKDIARWRATGRWEIQAHGAQAHDPVPLDGFGRRGRFLANRRWLAGEGRLETLLEYRARVEDEYREAKRGVAAAASGQRVVAFAFPSGDYGQDGLSNTPESAAINQALVRKNFPLAFVQDQYGMNTPSSNPADLKRFAVPRHMTAGALMSHLMLSDPRVQAKLLLARLWLREGEPARANAVFSELEAMGVFEPRAWADKADALRGGGISYAPRLPGGGSAPGGLPSRVLMP